VRKAVRFTPTRRTERVADRNFRVPVANAGDLAMATSKEYRQQADQCLQLARTTRDFFARAALTELAVDFAGKAERADAKRAPAHRRATRLAAPDPAGARRGRAG
jgi:hypothetical protein